MQAVRPQKAQKQAISEEEENPKEAQEIQPVNFEPLVIKEPEQSPALVAKYQLIEREPLEPDPVYDPGMGASQ